MGFSDNAMNIFNYIREHDGHDFTAQDIADALGLSKKTVDSTVTSAFQKKGLTVREPAEVEVVVDGKVAHKPVKFIRLTDAGRTFDPYAEDEIAEEDK